ncbi:DUF6151 family protein [Qipengyuania flava]|nr:DUF6151 family protein [Qipengyuania flava]
MTEAYADLPFACACGTIAGWIEKAGPRHGDHVVCHCSDCQEFARRLAAEDRVLNDADGTALYQSRCARVKVEQGGERLACFHLTEKPTLRWYAACCNTPMFNTYANGRIPYVTTVLANCDPVRRVALLGPPIGHLNLQDAVKEADGLAPMSMAKLMRRFFWRMVKDIASGSRRRSALFDPHTFEPISTPQHVGADNQPTL